jgi:hypothetical protein
MFSISRKLFLFCLLLTAGGILVQAQNPDPALLNIDRIFDSENFSLNSSAACDG